jgi:hypothetical protein
MNRLNIEGMRQLKKMQMMKRLKQKMNRLMDGFVSWLNRKTEQWPPVKKKIGLVLFCIVSGSISLYIIVSPMMGDSPAQPRFVFQRPFFFPDRRGHLPNHMLNHIGKPDLPTDHPAISKQLYDRIEAFKNNDSLMKAHPRLLDSIHAFEQLYQSQIKK